MNLSSTKSTSMDKFLNFPLKDEGIARHPHDGRIKVELPSMLYPFRNDQYASIFVSALLNFQAIFTCVKLEPRELCI